MLVFLANNEFTGSLLGGDLVYKGFRPCLVFRIITSNYGDALIDHSPSTSCVEMVNKVLTKC